MIIHNFYPLTITFLNLESIPRLVYGISDVTIKRGEALSLSCLFEGQPNITVVWELNGDYLRTDKRIVASEVVTDGEAGSTLFIKRVKSEEHGEISCRAWFPGLEKVSAKSAASIVVLGEVPFVDLLLGTTVVLSLHTTLGQRRRDVVSTFMQRRSKVVFLASNSNTLIALFLTSYFIGSKNFAICTSTYFWVLNLMYSSCSPAGKNGKK